MEKYLCYIVHDTPRQWRRWLPITRFWYNSSFHSSINYSLLKALCGLELNMGTMPLWDDQPPTLSNNKTWDWSTHVAQLHDQLARAQRHFKKKAHRNKIEHSFQVYDSILLKLQPYAQSSVAN